MGWGLYRLRVRQVARQLNVRFEERLAERTRIAQELHDTLLQGFVSASMQLHVAVERLPEDSPARSSFSRVTDLMGRVIEEGRNAVRGLRSSDGTPHDLEQAFSGIQQEFLVEPAVAFRVIVEGRREARCGRSSVTRCIGLVVKGSSMPFVTQGRPASRSSSSTERGS